MAIDASSRTKLVSSDDHLELHSLPVSLWQDRLPAKWRDEGPSVRDTDEGPMWYTEGKPWGPSGYRREMIFNIPFKRAGITENVAFRAADPVLRMQDMDLDGVAAQVVYPPLHQLQIANPELRTQCIQAFNDWAAEFNSVNPDRLCLLAQLPTHDPQAAAREVERIARAGHRGILYSFFTAQPKMFDPAWEPVWAAAGEARLSIAIHLGGGAHSLDPDRGGGGRQSWQARAYAATSPMQLDEVLTGVLLSGILERHPQLRFIMGESGIGWVPYMLWRIDRMYDQFSKRPEMGNMLAMKPTEYFRRQVYVTFEEDPIGVPMIPAIGADNVMWASDYPHPDGTFPHSREFVAEAFRELPEPIVRKVVCENAAQLYRFRLD